MSNIIFICTSNFDRSVALEKYFKEIYPNNEYRSAGVNKYFTKNKGTHLISEEDIEWSDILVFAEQIHLKVVSERFKANYRDSNNTSQLSDIYFTELDKEAKALVLECGEYEQGCVGEDYLTKAEFKLKKHIK